MFLYIQVNEQLSAQLPDLLFFSLERDYNNTSAEYYLLQNTFINGTTHEQTIISMQLFAGHVVGSRQIKKMGKCI